MATDSTKRLGYGGSGEVDGKQVLITSGSITKAVARPFATPLSIPANSVTRAQVLQALGTKVWTINLSFDVTLDNMTLFTSSRLLKRRYMFDIGYNDGEDAWRLIDCFYSSLSLAGSAGGLITCSISAMSASDIVSGGVDNNFIRDSTLLGYWWSGNTLVRDWNFDVTQEVSPRYTNQGTGTSSMHPRYLRVGTWGMSLNVTTYDSVQEHDTIQIATRTFKLTGVTTNEEYRYGGQDDLGMYSHNFEARAKLLGPPDTTHGSNNPILVIS